MSDRVSLCYARLEAEEDSRRFAYNDKTGKRVTCKTANPLTSGNLSIAIGVNLETGLDDDEIQWLTMHRLSLTDTRLRSYAWYVACDEVRGSVLLDLGFNNGVNGLLHYPQMIASVALQRWDDAANHLLDSDAARKDPHRYEPLAKIIQSG